MFDALNFFEVVNRKGDKTQTAKKKMTAFHFFFSFEAIIDDVNNCSWFLPDY